MWQPSRHCAADAAAGSTSVTASPDALLLMEAIAETSEQVAGGRMLGLAIVGYIGGELLNHQIHWSGGRWGLVFLSAALGLGLAGLLAVVTSTNGTAGAGPLPRFPVGFRE